MYCNYAPGAVVSEVARRHEITPPQLFAWRKAADDDRHLTPKSSSGSRRRNATVGRTVMLAKCAG
jgi:transposase-like protein